MFVAQDDLAGLGVMTDGLSVISNNTFYPYTTYNIEQHDIDKAELIKGELDIEMGKLKNKMLRTNFADIENKLEVEKFKER